MAPDPTTEPAVVILVGGPNSDLGELLRYARRHDWTPALTSALAGARHPTPNGETRTAKVMRQLLDRQAVTPLPIKLDERTPLYRLDDIDKAVADMPGQGTRPRARRQTD